MKLYDWSQKRKKKGRLWQQGFRRCGSKQANKVDRHHLHLTLGKMGGRGLTQLGLEHYHRAWKTSRINSLFTIFTSINRKKEKKKIHSIIKESQKFKQYLMLTKNWATSGCRVVGWNQKNMLYPTVQDQNL